MKGSKSKPHHSTAALLLTMYIWTETMAQRKNGDGRVPQNLEGYVTKKAKKTTRPEDIVCLESCFEFWEVPVQNFFL